LDIPVSLFFLFTDSRWVLGGMEFRWRLGGPGFEKDSLSARGSDVSLGKTRSVFFPVCFAQQPQQMIVLPSSETLIETDREETISNDGPPSQRLESLLRRCLGIPGASKVHGF